MEAVGENAKRKVFLPPQWTAPVGISEGPHVFVGYLLLDAWIGNTDRHHENWGWLVVRKGQAFHQGGGSRIQQFVSSSRTHLAPTFDHASSLGCHETDDNRKDRLTTKDRGRSIEKYARSARSAFFRDAGDKKEMFTHDAFRYAANRYPEAARIWLDRLNGIGKETVRAIIEKVPNSRMSEPAAEFATAVLDVNRSILLNTLEKSP